MILFGENAYLTQITWLLHILTTEEVQMTITICIWEVSAELGCSKHGHVSEITVQRAIPMVIASGKLHNFCIHEANGWIDIDHANIIP